MCGISGIVSPEIGQNPAHMAEIVRDMMVQMRRRGPDDAGYWSDGSRCGMGFRRLSILDLTEAGHQPMLTRDGRFALVFNGEVYNYRDIRRRLEQEGIIVRSTGDTEVVLHALATWGIEALGQFNGMFALAFYDVQEGGLLLARDHAGMKPLYYLHTPGAFAFASQYDQIMNLPFARSLDVSSEGLSLYLRFGYVPAPYAMLRNTHLLGAGEYLSIDREGRVEVGRHHELPDPGSMAPVYRGEEVDEALEEALTRAVARHLISDVPVGVLLSGGIDSPLVAAEAAHLSSEPLQAFTIGVPGSDADESDAAARFASELQLHHVLSNASPDAAIALLDDVVQACSEPAADYSIFPTLLVSRMASERVKVVLSGDGGDELFWGYPSRFLSAIVQAPYYRFPRGVRYALAGMRRYLGWGDATGESLWPSIGRLYQKKHTIMREDDLSITFPNLPSLPDDFTTFNFESTDPDETAQWVRRNEFYMHLSEILFKVDRASMHSSLEVRVPLLDKDVIEVALKSDWRCCLDPERRIGKMPLRRALRRHTPFQTEEKKGFTVPMHEWLKGPLRPLLQEFVLSRDELLGLEINRPHLQRMNESMRRGDRSKAWGLWLLLSLALWEERHLSAARAQHYVSR